MQAFATQLEYRLLASIRTLSGIYDTSGLPAVKVSAYAEPVY